KDPVLHRGSNIFLEKKNQASVETCRKIVAQMLRGREPVGVHAHPLFDLNYCIFCKFLYLLIGDARPAQPERAASPSQMISCVGVGFIRSPSAS
ncbi:MAG TPA: hypothetical protein DCK86_07610, partial [Rhodobacter sp.]|nr:hypothetical protein [Rhodobacter sp.]